MDVGGSFLQCIFILEDFMFRLILLGNRRKLSIYHYLLIQFFSYAFLSALKVEGVQGHIRYALTSFAKDSRSQKILWVLQ